MFPGRSRTQTNSRPVSSSKPAKPDRSAVMRNFLYTQQASTPDIPSASKHCCKSHRQLQLCIYTPEADAGGQSPTWLTHTRTVSCTSLRLLQLSESVLYDQSEDLQLLTNLSIMPIGRPLSSQLHTLHLLTDNDQNEDWL